MTCAQKHLSWCLYCLLNEGGCCTSPGEERRAAAHERESVSGPHFTVGPLSLIADSRPVYPLGLGMDQAAAAEESAADPASAAPIFGHHLGCALHVLHLAVTAGMTNPCFMGPLGVGSWHESPRDHADGPGYPCTCSLREGVGQPRFIMGVSLASWEGWLLRGARRASRAPCSCYAVGGAGRFLSRVFWGGWRSSE